MALTSRQEQRLEAAARAVAGADAIATEAREGAAKAMRDTGWDRIFNRLEAGFAVFTDSSGGGRKRSSRLSLRDRLGYVHFVGHLDADVVIEGIREWAASHTHLPAPAELLAACGTAEEAASPRHRRLRRRDELTAEIRRQAQEAIADGLGACACAPRPPAVAVDGRGLHRCPLCGELEAGFYDTVTADEEEWHRVRQLAGVELSDRELVELPPPKRPRRRTGPRPAGEAIQMRLAE